MVKTLWSKLYPVALKFYLNYLHDLEAWTCRHQFKDGFCVLDNLPRFLHQRSKTLTPIPINAPDLCVNGFKAKHKQNESEPPKTHKVKSRGAPTHFDPTISNFSGESRTLEHDEISSDFTMRRPFAPQSFSQFGSKL